IYLNTLFLAAVKSSMNMRANWIVPANRFCLAISPSPNFLSQIGVLSFSTGVCKWTNSPVLATYLSTSLSTQGVPTNTAQVVGVMVGNIVPVNILRTVSSSLSEAVLFSSWMSSTTNSQSGCLPIISLDL